MVAVLIDTPHSPRTTGAGRPLRLAEVPARPQTSAETAPETAAVDTPRRSEAVYLRRRVAAAVVALLALVAVVWIAEALVAAVIPEVSTSAPTVVETASAQGLMVADAQHVIVQPGDTLWSIARAVQPEGDVRPLVQRLAELNGGAQIRAGQALVLP